MRAQTLIYLVVVLSSFSRIALADPEVESGWESLMRTRPAQLLGLSAIETEALRLMDPEEAQKLTMGEPLEVVNLRNGESLASFLDRRGVSGFSMLWFSVDSGAGRLLGGSFTLRGTFGQAEVGVLNGDAFRLKGGFSVRSRAEIENIVFNDGFESGNTMRWDNVSPMQ